MCRCRRSPAWAWNSTWPRSKRPTACTSSTAWARATTRWPCRAWSRTGPSTPSAPRWTDERTPPHQGTPMRSNRLREIWAGGGAVVNGWLAIPNSFSAETMAHQGWDSLTIDLQHGVVDYQAMIPMLQAISTTDTVPVVRVPWLEPGILMKTLDAGAYGVICPMVNTREDAQKLVAYTPCTLR
eukprot:Opistho-1_new@28150